MQAYRTSVQESTGCTPFKLVFGREAQLPVDVMYGLPPQTSPTEVNQYALVREHMGLQHQRQKEQYNKSSNGDPFKVGDMVWLHCPAVPHGKSPTLHCFWQVPNRILNVVNDKVVDNGVLGGAEAPPNFYFKIKKKYFLVFMV